MNKIIRKPMQVVCMVCGQIVKGQLYKLEAEEGKRELIGHSKCLDKSV
jgi:hypothetical protein